MTVDSKAIREWVEAINEWAEGFSAPSDRFNALDLIAKVKRLETELQSWRATAEELSSRNVDKVLAQRHEMREKALKEEVGRLEAQVKALVEKLEAIAYFTLHSSDTAQLGFDALKAFAKEALAGYKAQKEKGR